MNVSFINCCAVPLHYIAHSFCPATLNGVLGSCLQKSKFYSGVLWVCHRNIGPGKIGPAGPILDTKTGPAGQNLVDQV